MDRNKQFRATTVCVTETGNGKWTAECHIQRGKHCQSGFMEAWLYTRYSEESISKAVDYILSLLREWNVYFPEEPGLYYYDNNNLYPAPENYKEILREESERIGFDTYESAYI